MLTRLTKYLSFGTNYCAIEHAKGSIHVLQLLNKKEGFLLDGERNFDSFEELTAEKTTRQAAYLILNDDTILTKTIDHQLEGIAAVQKAFPSLTISEFYWDIYHANSQTAVSICRKVVVDKWIQQYQEHEFNLLGIALGNSTINAVIPQVELSCIKSSNIAFTIKKKQLETIVTIKDEKVETYNIQDLSLTNQSVLALGGIISYYTGVVTQSNLVAVSEALKKNSLFKRYNSLGLKFGMSILLATLVINFLFFTHYQTEITEIQSRLTINETYKLKLIDLKNNVAKSKKIVDQLLYSKSSRSSFYLDRVGESVPNSIILNQLQFQPLLHKIKENEPVSYDFQSLYIEGVLLDSKEFTAWITILEKETWVKKVHLEKFGTQHQKKTTFKLRIQLYEES